MKKLFVIPLTIVLLSALIFGGCAKPAPAPAPAPAGPIKIGALIPLTGPYALWGEMFMTAFEFALDEAGHEVAGRPIEFIVEDEGGEDVTMALEKAKKLVEADKVDLMTGPFYGGSGFSVFPYTASVPIVDIHYREPSSEKGEIGNDYVYIISKGAIVYQSTPKELRDNEEAKARYLGVTG